MTAASLLVRAPLFTGPESDHRRYQVDHFDFDNVQFGGEGLLFRATDLRTGQRVALKMLTNRRMAEFPSLSERSSVFSNARHPHLMRQFDVFVGPGLSTNPTSAEDDEVIYSTSEWIDGVPLTDCSATASIRTKLGWVTEIAGALNYLHCFRESAALQGIVHRDVKPSNIRIRNDNSAVLLDFGLARAVSSGDMTAGIGTYHWCAPEVLDGSTTQGVRIDTWGLGALAHWLVVGEPPRLDGAAGAKERLLGCQALTEFNRPKAIARHIAWLLESSPANRPDDLTRWATQLSLLTRSGRAASSKVKRAASTGFVVTLLTWGLTAQRGTPYPMADATVRPKSPAHSSSRSINASCDAEANASNAAINIAFALDDALSATGATTNDAARSATHDGSIEATVEVARKSFLQPRWGEPRKPLEQSEISRRVSEIRAFLYWWVNAEGLLPDRDQPSLDELHKRLAIWSQLASRSKSSSAPCHKELTPLRCVDQMVLKSAHDFIAFLFHVPATSIHEADERLSVVAAAHANRLFRDPVTGGPGTLTGQLQFCSDHSK